MPINKEIEALKVEKAGYHYEKGLFLPEYEKGSEKIIVMLSGTSQGIPACHNG